MSNKNINSKLVSGEVEDVELFSDLVRGLEQSGPPFPETPFGATKTAELNVLFNIDPSYGLSEARYGWYSNENLFDDQFFDEEYGKIKIETDSQANSTARIRSAYSGRYLPHTIAEPGIGVKVPEEYLEYDSDGYASLTHGEMTFGIAQWSDTNQRPANSFGVSLESDGAYFKVRSGDENVEYVPQSEWNIDKMDGNGPSQRQFRPEYGYVYLMLYSWYGEGALTLALSDSREDDIIPVHYYPNIDGNKHLEAPNMPVMVTVDNKSTASNLSCRVGGMQYTVHGKASTNSERRTREFRHTTNSFIDKNVIENNGAVDAFAEPGVPLISVRRNQSIINSRKGLSLNIENIFANVGNDCYLFLFDEYDNAALTGANFTPPQSRGGSADESLVETDTEATAYTPSNNAVLRGMAFLSSGGLSEKTVLPAGDTGTQPPLEATTVLTAALAPGKGATDASPSSFSVIETW